MSPRSAPAHEWTARALSEKTWKDFEGLFARYNGVQAGCWCMFYHREGPIHAPSEEERTERNRQDHRAWVGEGRAHGVLVYEGGEAIGWCQFGPRKELPRLERGRTYRALDLPPSRGALWRITCFFVDRPHRRQGVAEFALGEALREIRRMGGGTVEAFPATHGRAVAIWFGTVGMFEAQGFRDVGPFGKSHRLMRRTLR